MQNLLNKHLEKHANAETDIYVNLCYDFMDEIQNILKEKGWSQKDLADKMGKSPAEVSKIINGLHNVTFKTVAKLSHALGVDLMIANSKAKAKFGTGYYGKTTIDIKRFFYEIPQEYNDINSQEFFGKVIHIKKIA